MTRPPNTYGTVASCCLRGPSGWGKQATAQRLLMDVAPGGVFGLEPDLDVQRLGSRTLAEGGGHVVDGLPPDRAEALTATQLHRLTAECRRRESASCVHRSARGLPFLRSSPTPT